MLQKLSNTQVFLILVGTAIVGFFIGNFVSPIKDWFASSGPDETPSTASDCTTADGQAGKKDATGNCVALGRMAANRANLINQITAQYANHPSLNAINKAIANMSTDDLNNVIAQKTVWCVCGDADYGFTQNCRAACA